jgi:DnaD/phage-associated family protein
LAKPLNGTITAGLINIYEYYGFDVPSIVMIAEYSRSVGKTSIAYIETVAKDWFSRGITDFTQVEQEIIRLTEQHNFEVEVAHRLGIEGKLTKQQRDFISQWKDWGFDVRLIELAGDECRNKKNTIKLPYVNGILGRWKQDNLFTEQAIMEHNEKFRSKYSQNQQSDGKNGNAPSAEKSYDLNQWRDMAAAFNPNTLGFEEDDDI